MLGIDTPGIDAGEIADKLFIRRWVLKGVFLEDLQQKLSLRLKAGPADLLCVFQRLAGEVKRPCYHFKDFLH